MPPRMAPALRERIIADIKAGKKSRNQIARDHGVSAGTVTNLSRTLPGESFDRAHALKGARAKAADNRALRAQLQSDLLMDAQRLRARAWSSYSLPMQGMEGPEIIELDLPPLPDVRAAYTSIGIVVDKDLAYERAAAASGGTAHAESLLGRIAAAITDAVGPETTPDDG